MAKIILVSKHVTPTSWQLAQALRSQQHEVVILTSRNEEPLDDLHNIQFMAYFKKWNFLEGLKIIPGLFGLQPQILHLILDDDRMNRAQMLLSTFAKSHPSCVLTTSLLNIRFGLRRTNPVRYLVEESDIVTCPTVEALGQLRGLNVRANQQGRGILAPALDFRNGSLEDLYADGSEARLIADLADEKYFVVPFRQPHFNPESENLIRIRTLAQKHKVVLWGSYSHWSLRDRKQFAGWMAHFECEKRWVVTGSMPVHLSRYLLENATAFVLAGQKFTPVEMTEYYMRAIQSQAVMILDSRQTSVHSDLWKN
ncbi:MAG TPA: hypothetical protein VN132_08455, partial [Bdellovibrio sp.]|nr:hypothetical protein [Bdellovibrio sp.]